MSNKHILQGPRAAVRDSSKTCFAALRRSSRIADPAIPTAGLQQKELADLAGLDASYLSLIEMGKRKPSLSAVTKLSKALRIPQHLFTLLASESDDLSIADPKELQRVGESLTQFLIGSKGSNSGEEL